MKKLPTSTSGIQKLAQKEFKKKAVRNRRDSNVTYREGDPSDKVWDNYQLTKGLKRQFKELCAKENIVASEYLRTCIKILIKKKGTVKTALKAVEAIETEKETNQ